MNFNEYIGEIVSYDKSKPDRFAPCRNARNSPVITNTLQNPQNHARNPEPDMHTAMCSTVFEHKYSGLHALCVIWNVQLICNNLIFSYSAYFSHIQMNPPLHSVKEKTSLRSNSNKIHIN